MNKGSHYAGARVFDVVALKVQELHTQGKLGVRPLLRVDYQKEAAKAPFLLDAANGRLHRRGCRSIPKRSLSALYAVWRIGNEEKRLACSRCNPMPTNDSSEDRGFASDLLYGFLSVVDQFGGVLRERGLEYRDSVEGQRLAGLLEGFYRGLGEQEKKVVGAVLVSLDGLAKTIKELDSSLNGANGHGVNNHNANNHGQAAPTGKSKKKRRQNGGSVKR